MESIFCLAAEFFLKKFLVMGSIFGALNAIQLISDSLFCCISFISGPFLRLDASFPICIYEITSLFSGGGCSGVGN